MQPLQPDTSYPVFNPANGFENVFRHEANYITIFPKLVASINMIPNIALIVIKRSINFGKVRRIIEPTAIS